MAEGITAAERKEVTDAWAKARQRCGLTTCRFNAVAENLLGLIAKSSLAPEQKTQMYRHIALLKTLHETERGANGQKAKNIAD